MTVKKLIIVGIALLYALPTMAFAATADDVNKLLADAEKNRKQAASLGFEWRDTGKIMKKAKKQLAAGDVEGAMKSAEYARFQGEAAIKQAHFAETDYLVSIPK